MLINGREVGMFGELNSKEKIRLQQLAMVLCPQVLGTSSNKFDKVALVFLEFGPVLSSNIRDLFSAGGKVTHVASDGQILKIRSIDNKFKVWALELQNHLETIPEETLERYWGKQFQASHSERLEQYLKLADHHSQTALISVSLSTLFLDSIRLSASPSTPTAKLKKA